MITLSTTLDNCDLLSGVCRQPSVITCALQAFRAHDANLHLPRPLSELAAEVVLWPSKYKQSAGYCQTERMRLTPKMRNQIGMKLSTLRRIDVVLILYFALHILISLLDAQTGASCESQLHGQLHCC